MSHIREPMSDTIVKGKEIWTVTMIKQIKAFSGVINYKLE